jgi:DNA polymerase III subunit delta
MAALRESELTGFLRSKASKANGVLLFGNDDAAISAASQHIAATMAGNEEPQRINAAHLRGDPALLDEAFRSMSLLGDRRLVIVTGVEEAHLSLLQPLFDETRLGNFLVLTSDSLKKGSKLRGAAEASPMFAAIAFYEEAGGARIERAHALLKVHGLSFSEGAAERVIELCGSDRMVLMGEVEKLALYCHPAKTVTIEDVDAICGDQAEFGSDEMSQSVLDGDLEKTDRIFQSMLQTAEGKSALIMLQLYLSRLEGVSSALGRGVDFASACRSARPPIFDRQQPATRRHLNAWSGGELGRAQAAVQQAMLQARQMADLGDAITGRCLLSLARMARQLHARAAA